MIAMENGDIYTIAAQWPDYPVPPPFVYFGNPLSGAVGVEGTAWGKFKEGFRK
jgi:hypothetical protein